MSEHLIQLCCLIIEDVYGDFLSHIFKQLATFGRLPLGQIAQRCRLLQRHTKTGIGALVQLRLVQHHTSNEGFSTYQVNLTNAYNLLRTGKLAELAHTHYGTTAALIIETLAVSGFRTLKQLEMAVCEPSASSNGNHAGRNGCRAPIKFQSALRSLIRDGFIGQVRRTHFLIPHDARQGAENSQAQVTAGGKKGETERIQRATNVAAEMDRKLDSQVSVEAIDEMFEPASEDHGVEPLYLCPNYSHVITSVRDASLSQHVAKTLGKPSSRLVSAVMKQIPRRVTPLEPDPNAREEVKVLVLSQLHDDAQRACHSPQTNGHHDAAMTNGVEVNDFADREDVEDGLLVLSEGPYPFLQLDDATGQWGLDQYRVATWLRDREILRLTSARTGSTGMRLVRMLVDKGKLDEKLLQEVGLLAAKEMRQALAELHTMGFIELQEVPREPQRQPSRTIYLWFYDATRARDLLLGEIYKTMARLYQRLQTVERERTKATLEKIDRDDVRGRIEEVVVGQEMVELQQFQAKEKWLMAEIARLDDSVVLLRDL